MKERRQETKSNEGTQTGVVEVPPSTLAGQRRAGARGDVHRSRKHAVRSAEEVYKEELVK